MPVLLLAYLGGVLTIFSPCVLPVIPFVFARADRPFLRSGLPLFIGMALTFAAVATLATVGGGWAVRANAIGRWVAIVLLSLFAITLLSPWLANRLSRPFVALGGRLMNANSAEATVWQSGLIGVATGLLWAPCAGPILGLILTGAALQGPGAQTVLLLLAYALGAVTSLALVLWAGKRGLKLFKPSPAAETWIRRSVGVLVLAGVLAIVFGLDRGVLTRLSAPATGGLESRLIAALDPSRAQRPQVELKAGEALPVIGPAPDFNGATAWLNSSPLTLADLKGKVVLVDFWTYSCINCIRNMPFVDAWAERYKDQGLVVIGVHTPEFAFEHDLRNVRKAVADFGVKHPVAVDNDWTIWNAYKNQYWPALYFIDAQGRIRYQRFGEGYYAQSEQVIRSLLAEANGAPVSGPTAAIEATALQAPVERQNLLSPETYTGYRKGLRFVSPGGFAQDAAKTYAAPATLALNDWALAGRWTVGNEQARAGAAGARILYRFHARDLHMVLGASGKPVRIRVRIDGKPPGDDHGLDIDANGDGTVSDQRLYQLIRQKTGGAERLFEIEVLDPGLEAFSFTFS